jgi:hypothetical protein
MKFALSMERSRLESRRSGLGNGQTVGFWENVEMICLVVETGQAPLSYSESPSRDSSNEPICARNLVC